MPGNSGCYPGSLSQAGLRIPLFGQGASMMPDSANIVYMLYSDIAALFK